jgi:hypothetical protein
VLPPTPSVMEPRPYDRDAKIKRAKKVLETARCSNLWSQKTLSVFGSKGEYEGETSHPGLRTVY